MTRNKEERTYVAIDLKSFYASVECVDRGLDPLGVNLVVADESRTEKTICLAVSPALKAYGISGRARLFEVVQRVREVNDERRRAVGGALSGKSYDDRALHEHPDWEVDYVVAPPRMAHYMKVSTQVYQTYLKYVAPEDIHVYSIDEVFMDVTNYLGSYRMTAHELAMTMIRDVLRQTGITATAGIGTNMYLCKVAMDIVAKHMPADQDGVRVAELNERSYREQLWDHRPLTAFWRVGRGVANRLLTRGIDTMGKLARYSLTHEDDLYRLFGVNAELVIDHAWGYEPCTMAEVKAYRPETHSLSNGQVLQEPYSWQKARVVVQEMADAAALDLVAKRKMTDQVVLTIGYERLPAGWQGSPASSGQHGQASASSYQGPVSIDHYGRLVPKHAQGTANLGGHTSSNAKIIRSVAELFDRIVDRSLMIRRLNISVNHVLDEAQVVSQRNAPRQLDLFTDYEEQERRRQAEDEQLRKERRLQDARLTIKQRFGKNAILKGLNFQEGATQKERNEQIGGHRS